MILTQAKTIFVPVPNMPNFAYVNVWSKSVSIDDKGRETTIWKTEKRIINISYIAQLRLITVKDTTLQLERVQGWPNKWIEPKNYQDKIITTKTHDVYSVSGVKGSGLNGATEGYSLLITFDNL